MSNPSASTPPRVDLADALYALKAAEAVEKSIEKKQVVNLSF
jgi:hypothetical protein